MLLAMSPQTSARILSMLSLVFGITVAAPAIFGSDAVGIFAAIGGMVLGLLWVARSFFIKRPS
jgi:membrane associated rhomboid family serine protease